MASAEKNDEAPNSAPLGAMASVIRRLDMFPDTYDGASISELKDYIHRISNKLKKLSEVQEPSLTVNYWMKHARELSYDIEAFLDDLDAKTGDHLNYSDAKKEDNPVDSDAKLEDCMNDSDKKTEYADDLYAMMEDYIDDSDDEMKDSVDDSDGSIQESICSSDYKISGFRTRAKEMVERYKSFSLDSVLSSSTARTTIVSPRPSRDVVLIGMGNQITNVISLLQPKDENDNQLKIVSILGDEGIGKSTLVQEIWHESFKERKIWPESQSEVKIIRAFVQMGKKADVRMILRSILLQVSLQEPAKDSGVKNLIQDIRKHLEQKRYFIIVDDVGSLSVWDVVGRAFPHGSLGSRIITTTSDKEIAMACCCYVLQHNYTVEPLSVDDSKELFFRTVGLGTVDLQLSKQVSDEIKRKCGGLPLAIIWTAILMASKLETEQELSRTEKEQKLYSDVKKFLDENLRTGLTPVEILNQVLKQCYSSLPHCLMTCLLYLSLYPENYIFLKEDLVKVWMAEDFICASEEDKVEAAGRYFDVLASLGLIQRMDINCNKRHHQGEVAENNEVCPLRVHYVVHPTVFDFITSKSTEDNFITIMDCSQLTVVLKEKIRRLSLLLGSATYATTLASVGLSHVRTLSFIGLLRCMPSLVEFKIVRVLILHLWADDGDKKFPLAEICRLVLLRYLQVRGNVTVELPAQIVCLKHLETLEINSIVTAVPSDIFQLSRLLHLRLGLKQNPTPGPVAAVNAICSDELLPPRDDSSITDTPVQIFELLLPICIFSRLPEWIPQLRKLSILEIVVRELCTTDIDMLADLPALTALSLYVRIPTTGNIVFRRGAFQALKYFRFMCGVLSLHFQEEAMPNLQQLLIGFNVHGRGKYANILAGIEHLLNLDEVVASIGATMGTEETERIAAVSALKDTIYKHPYPTKLIVKTVHQVEEEYRPPTLDPLSMNDQEEAPVIHGPKTEDCTNEQPINLEKKPTKDTHGMSPVTGKGYCREHKESTHGGKEKGTGDPRMVLANSPFGYESNRFKPGPLSCSVCQALLHESSKCMPCAHKFCKACISRFKDCPLCGADIERVEPDAELQALVDRFIHDHARIKRSHATGDVEAAGFEDKIIYEGVAMERGAFLAQQAMRAFRAQNIESAKSRLTMCADDIREELKSSEDNLELCSQLGAVSGMLGDCCRTLGDFPSAIKYYEESAEILSKLPTKDLELVHTLSVSLNKIGDLRYYDGDLKSARNYFVRSLDVRRNAVKKHPAVASQIIDLATSLAKVADVDRNLGNESTAVEGFQEAIQYLENLELDSGQATLEQRRLSVLQFLDDQLADNVKTPARPTVSDGPEDSTRPKPVSKPNVRLSGLEWTSA